MKCSWKEASTIILTALKRGTIKETWNYAVLTLERSSKSSFMPNGCVFPGGTTESADCSKKWLDIFSNCYTDISTSQQITGVVPPIVTNQVGDIPKLVSLKITAIRETFEETGILICSSNKKEPKKNWASYIKYPDLDKWRAKVQKDASEFLNLCEHYNCCPDISNLHIWSNWLTPTSMGQKRFDTAFFVASLQEHPEALADQQEVEKLSWNTPKDLMELCENKKIWLPPPQVYETARLLQFKDIADLNNFASKRSIEGCHRWMPIQIKTSNGSVSLLPGDDAYIPIDYSTPTEKVEVKESNEEHRIKYKCLHRLEFLNQIETKVVVKNYNPTNNHVLPAVNYQ